MRPLDYVAASNGLTPQANATRNMRIRRSRENGATFPSLAKEFGLSVRRVRNICIGAHCEFRRRGWNHKHNLRRGSKPTFDHAECRKRYLAGESHHNLAASYGVSISATKKVCVGILRPVKPRKKSRGRSEQRKQELKRLTGYRHPRGLTFDWLPFDRVGEYTRLVLSVGTAEAKRILRDDLSRQMKKAA